MPRNIPPNIKIQAVEEYLSGKGSCQSIARKYGVGKALFKRWVIKYQALGKSALIRTGHNASYYK